MVTSDVRFAQSKSVLRTLARNSFKAIDAGAYEINNTIERSYFSHKSISLKNSIQSSQIVPLITEIHLHPNPKGS